MASIGKPSKKYLVNNCEVGKTEQHDSAVHDPKYYQNTDKFYVELSANTRRDTEVETANNPCEFMMTELMDVVI